LAKTLRESTDCATNDEDESELKEKPNGKIKGGHERQ
jgi:hypothetical protein